MSYKQVDTVTSLINKKYLLFSFALIYALLACQSHSKSAKRKRKTQNKDLEIAQYANSEGALFETNNSEPKPTQINKNSVKQSAPVTKNKKVLEFKDNCHALVKRFAPYYQDLFKALPAHLQASNSTRLQPLLAMKPEDCQDEDLIKQTLGNLREIATSYKPCVGMILPVSGGSRRGTEGVIRGLRAALQDLKGHSASFEEIFKIRDTGGLPAKAKMHFAELALTEQCGIIAGGIEFKEALEMIPLAQGIQQPLLVLSGRAELPQEAPSIFGLFPTESRLASALVKGCKSRSIQKVAIMRPSHGRSDKLIEQFKIQFTAQGGTIVDDVTYTSSQFDAMQTAARKLFRTDIIGREFEYQEAIKNAKKKAEKAQEKFNPKMVLLSPQVSFDALFVPDDFRSVRHMIKLIKYHMVPKLTLIGNHEWRSQGLLNPPEPFLDQSFFVDFVPRYDQIPKSIPVSFDGSPFFAQPQNATQIDFQLIGYHIGRVILKAFEDAPKNRLALIPHLAELKLNDLITLQPQMVFDQKRQALWPTFGYLIQQGNIQSFGIMTSELVRKSKTEHISFSVLDRGK